MNDRPSPTAPPPGMSFASHSAGYDQPYDQQGAIYGHDTGQHDGFGTAGYDTGAYETIHWGTGSHQTVGTVPDPYDQEYVYYGYPESDTATTGQWGPPGIEPGIEGPATHGTGTLDISSFITTLPEDTGFGGPAPGGAVHDTGETHAYGFDGYEWYITADHQGADFAPPGHGSSTYGADVYDTGSYDTGLHGTGLYETGLHDTGAYDMYDTAVHDDGMHDTALYDTAAHGPALHDTGAHDTGTYDTGAHDRYGPGTHDTGIHEAETHDTGEFDTGHGATATQAPPAFPAVAVSDPPPLAEAPRNRRRAPQARRSALLTVAVPSVAVMGVAAVAAASVSAEVSAHSDDSGPTTQAAPDPAQTALANSKLDTQLDGLSRDADDFRERASRTQERIDLRKRQEAERKRRAAEAARREALRPKFWLPVEQRGLSAYYGQAGVNWMSVHTGIDFPVSYGTPVMAATDGVVSTRWDYSYGNMAVVTAPDGTETWYCHLSSTKILSGHVKAGDTIAYSGNSGNSTGPHLHFEVRPGGGSAIDPLSWLRGQGLDPT